MRLVVKNKAKKYIHPQKQMGILTKGESQCGKRAWLSKSEAGENATPCWACGNFHEGAGS